jgi:hypothetical protein
VKSGAGGSAPAHLGFQDPTARSTSVQKKDGASPMAIQPPASAPIGPSINIPGSWACSAALVRGAPRKTIAPALVKLANANAPAAASIIAAGIAIQAAGPRPVAVSKRPR